MPDIARVDSGAERNRITVAQRRRLEPTLALGNPDPKIEQMLRDQFKAKFTFLSGVNTSQINMERSRANNARREALNAETTKKYVAAMRRGDNFPPIIAYYASRGAAKKLTVADGNHRVAAADEADKTLDVYVLDPETPANIISMITMVGNTKNGLALTPADQVDHAISLVDNKVSHRDACELMGIKEGALRSALQIREADNRAKAARVNIRIWEGLSPTVRARLNAITTDGIFKDAAILAHDVPMTTVEVSRLVSALKPEKDLAKQREILKHHRNIYQDRIGSSAGGLVSNRGPLTPKTRVAIGISHLGCLSDDPGPIAALYKGEEREELIDTLETLNLRVASLLKYLQDGDD